MKILDILLILAAIFSRLVSHAPNFTAIGAVALFAGYLFKTRREALFISFTAMLVSDIVIGFHSTLFWVYGAFALIALLGHGLTKFSWLKALGLSVASAVLFFIVTNFGVWASMSLYPKTAQGLGLCYVAAIPFFWNTLASQLIFGGLLFGLHQTVGSQKLKSTKAFREKKLIS